MADMYFDTGSQPHYYSNSQHIDFRFGNAPPIDQELMMQQHIQTSQLLSPTQHQRHDSLFGTSPSTTPKAGVSPQQHRAEPQFGVANAQPTPHVLPHFPVNMQRCGSHYSIFSTGQRQHIRQHRASMENATRPSAVGMSRSSTQNSRGSIGHHYQAESHSRESVPTFTQTYSTSETANIADAFESRGAPYDPATTSTAYKFDFIHTSDGKSAGEGNVGQMFGPEVIFPG
jgi:hypothetical protein